MRAPDGLLPTSALIAGFAATGEATARVLIELGVEVAVFDDLPSEHAIATSRSLGLRLFAAPSATELSALVESAEVVVVSPGLPQNHVLFELAKSKAISEIELAVRLFHVPVVAITGTNGKTTVTTLVAQMLVESGIGARALGNIGSPLVSGLADADVELAVCEASSFQLARTVDFHPVVATWLNFAEDHLDWHRDLADYEEAKAKIFANLGPSDVVVYNVEDEVVAKRAEKCPARLVGFGRDRGDYHLDKEQLVGPSGPLVSTRELARAMPHDVVNALAAFASAIEAGASVGAAKGAICRGELLPHRVSHVATIASVAYYDDSKATTPSAVIAALGGFSSVVLICGGRNKGLDLSQIAKFVNENDRLALRAVVAIGEAASQVATAFRGVCPVEPAPSMPAAVEKAATLARPGDAVLLSPGCASFDWYSSYAARGEHFSSIVEELADSMIRGGSA